MRAAHRLGDVTGSAGRRAIRTDVVTKNSLTPLAQIKLIKFNTDLAGAQRTRILAKWNDLLLNKK